MLIQSLVVAVAYALAVVLLFMPSIPYDDPRFTLRRRVLYAAGMVLYALILTYGIACAVDGGCASMTWVTVVMYAVVPSSIVFLYATAFYSMERLRRRTARLWNEW